MPLILGLQEVALAWRRARLGDHKDTALTINFIGMNYLKLAHDERAEVFLTEVCAGHSLRFERDSHTNAACHRFAFHSPRPLFPFPGPGDAAARL